MPHLRHAFDNPGNPSDYIATAVSPSIEALLGDGYSRGEVLSGLLFVMAELMGEMSQNELGEHTESMHLYLAGVTSGRTNLGSPFIGP
jgi:hypothetical protein